MRQRSLRDIFIIGFALFSMFFGAGNVIFPPYLGMGAGPQWGLGFSCYYIADIGLALLALFSMFHKGGSEPILRPIGRIPANLLMCVIVLCIGPMLAIPRTAAMTYEMAVQPIASGINSVVFSILFFALVFLCSIRQNSVVDIVGKILTPMLLLGLLILIVKGVLTPLGEFSLQPQLDNVAAEGIKAGYQTMDVLATMLFGVLILRSTESKGYIKHHDCQRVAICSSIVAGVMLFVVYGGLTYLGATVSTMYDLTISRPQLVMAIVTSLLGQQGGLLFALVVALACVTTAVGLVSACSDYFSSLSRHRIGYRALVTGICVFSAVVSNVGLDRLVSIAAPVLDIVYPPALVLIALSFLPSPTDLTCRLGTVGALLFSLMTTVDSFGLLDLSILEKLPLSSLGFGWVLPSALFALVGALLSRKHTTEPESQPAA